MKRICWLWLMRPSRDRAAAGDVSMNARAARSAANSRQEATVLPRRRRGGADRSESRRRWRNDLRSVGHRAAAVLRTIRLRPNAPRQIQTYDKKAPKIIPQLVLAVEHYNRIARMIAGGRESEDDC